jgi:CHAD domain-containing protein
MTVSNRSDENVVTGRFGATRDEDDVSSDDSASTGEHNREPMTDDGRDPSASYLEVAVGLGYRPLPSLHAEHSDAYWDTEAFELLRAGFALRLRGTPAGVQVTLKSLDRPSFEDLEMQRLEVGGLVEDVSRPLDPTSWPEAVREPVRAAAGEAPELLPICVLHQRHERIPLVNGEGGNGPVVAALNIDVVGIFDSRGIAADDSLRGVTGLLEDGAPIVNVTELELEPVAEDAPAVVRDLAKRLRAIPDFAPAAGSQLEQALEILADHPPGSAPGKLGIFHGMPMAEAGRLMWRRQLLALLLNEAGARRGEDPEYVHDMRVATRRARAVARLFGPFFRRKALREHLKNLRRTARALGAVRDADVALLKLRKYAKSRPDSEQQGLAEIRAVWRVERRQAYRSLLEWLDSPDYRSFVASFAEFCRTAGLGARTEESGSETPPAPCHVGDVMPSAILNRFEQLRAYERLFESAQPLSVSALHALRIDCKALRYSLETVEHLLGEEGGEIVQQMKRLQDLLGDLHDAVVADGRLAELADAVEPTALASYRVEQQSILAELVSAAPEAWRTFVAPDNRRRLAVAIARL